MAKVTAVNPRGEKQTIPEHWLTDPRLGKDFKLPPSAKVRESAAEKRAEPEPDTKA